MDMRTQANPKDLMRTLANQCHPTPYAMPSHAMPRDAHGTFPGSPETPYPNSASFPNSAGSSFATRLSNHSVPFFPRPSPPFLSPVALACRLSGLSFAPPFGSNTRRTRRTRRTRFGVSVSTLLLSNGRGTMYDVLGYRTERHVLFGQGAVRPSYTLTVYLAPTLTLTKGVQKVGTQRRNTSSETMSSTRSRSDNTQLGTGPDSTPEKNESSSVPIEKGQG